MIPAADIERARAIPIQNLLDQSKMKKQGGRLIGPCPRCGGTDRFSLDVRKQLFFCRRCELGGGGAIDFIVFVHGSCSFLDAVCKLVDVTTTTVAKVTVNGNAREEETDEKKIEKARWLWSKSINIEGTPAEAYLREVRGYRGPVPGTLHYLGPYKNYPGCLVAPFGPADEPEPGHLTIRTEATTGLLLTYLKSNGTKADIESPKQFRGKCKGAPIMLAAVNDLGGLLIAEGIEDAVSGHLATGLGAWAAGSGVFLPALDDVVPSYVESVTLIEDRDAIGRTNTAALADKLVAKGIEVFIARARTW